MPSSRGGGFMKPCALLKLNFLTGVGNKMHSLVRKSSFSKALRQNTRCALGMRELPQSLSAEGLGCEVRSYRMRSAK